MGISPQLLYFPYGHWCLPWVIFLMFTTQFNGLEMPSSNWGEKPGKVVADCCIFLQAPTADTSNTLKHCLFWCQCLFNIQGLLGKEVFLPPEKARLLVLPLFISVSVALLSTASQEMLWASLVWRIHRWSPHSPAWFLQWNLFSLLFLFSAFLGFFSLWKFSFFYFSGISLISVPSNLYVTTILPHVIWMKERSVGFLSW